MPSVTLTLLRDTVYRRLGDRGYFASSSTPTAATLGAVDEAINASIAEHVKIAEWHGYKPLNESADVPVFRDENPQLIGLGGAVAGGTFTLTFFGVETAAIAYNATANDVQSALNAVRDVQVAGSSALLVTGGAVIWTATWTPGDRPSIPLLTADASNLTPGTATATVESTTGDTYPREYNLDHHLWDASDIPNFRGDLVIWRTDTEDNVPVRWAEGGDYRVRESYRGSPRFGAWPDESVNEYPGINDDLVNLGRAGEQLVLYRRGPYIGFVKTPTENMTLTCHYTPALPLLVNNTDTLWSTLGLPFLQDWRELLGQYAAIQLHADINSPTGERLEQRYGQLLASYIIAVKDMAHVVTPAMRRRWRA